MRIPVKAIPVHTPNEVSFDNGCLTLLIDVRGLAGQDSIRLLEAMEYQFRDIDDTRPLDLMLFWAQPELPPGHKLFRQVGPFCYIQVGTNGCTPQEALRLVREARRAEKLKLFDKEFPREAEAVCDTDLDILTIGA